MCRGLLVACVRLWGAVALSGALGAFASGCELPEDAPAMNEASGLPPELIGEPPGPKGPLEERDIRILSDVRVELGFGDRAKLRVLLRDEDGDPVEGERVSFGLRGRSQDAGLDVLDALSDEGGEANATLTAGDMAATFEVRVSAAGALDRHIAVAIGDSGFGSLAVHAPYAGERDVRERVVVVQQDGRCRDLSAEAPPPGDPSFTLLGEQDTAEFLALPAGERYAVAGFGQGPTGVVIALGCVDEVPIDDNHTRELALEWNDLVLVPAAQMVLALQLNARAAGSWLSGVLESAAGDAVKRDADGELLGADAEARFLLDTLDATLREDEDTLELADAVLMARADAAGALESSFRSRLAIEDQGPLRSVAALAARTADVLEKLSLRASLRVDVSGTEYELSTWTSQLSARGEDDEVVAMLDLSQAAPASPGHATLVAGEDALVADSLRMQVALGALTVSVVRALIESDSQVETLLGCGTLEEWLEDQAIEGGESCGSDCIDAVCERVRLRLLATAEPALLAVDEARPEIELAGRLELSDMDGDLRVDVIDAAELRGAWLAASTGGSSATLSGLAQATALVVAE